MTRTLYNIAFWVVVLTSTAATHAQSGGEFDLSWNKTAGGGGSSSGGGFTVRGTVGQSDVGTLSGGDFMLAGGFWAALSQAASAVNIVSANPPLDDPFTAGMQPFRDVLEHVSVTSQPRGIGAAGTPGVAGITYASPSVTFSGSINPAPASGNIVVTCTDIAANGQADCPTVTVTAPGVNPNEYVLTLSGRIPARECTTITFAGTAPGQKVQYRFLPGDVSIGAVGSGIVTAQDVSTLIAALNSGTANSGNNPARYNVNRVGGVTSQDIARLLSLLNAGLNGATVASCP